jgi:hypothetical protein
VIDFRGFGVGEIDARATLQPLVLLVVVDDIQSARLSCSTRL